MQQNETHSDNSKSNKAPRLCLQMPLFLNTKQAGGKTSLKSPDKLLTDILEGFQHKTADTPKGGASIFRPSPLNLLQHRNSRETAGTDLCKGRELVSKPSAELSTSPTSFGLALKK